MNGQDPFLSNSVAAPMQNVLRSFVLMVSALLFIAGLSKLGSTVSGVIYFWNYYSAISSYEKVFLIVLGVIEVAFACLLYRTRATRGLIVGIAFLFSIFALVASYWMWRGEFACPCFGRLGVPTWAILVCDVSVVAVAILFLMGADRTVLPQAERYSLHTRALIQGGLFAIAFAFCAGALVATCPWVGSPLMVYLTERSEEASGPAADRSDAVTPWKVVLVSRRREKVTIFGCCHTCGIRIIDPLPVGIAPGSTLVLNVFVPQQYRGGAALLRLYTDIDQQSSIPFIVKVPKS